MRRGELLSLQWKDIAFQKAHALLTVRAENTKTDSSRVVVVSSARLGAVLHRRRLGPNGRPLGGEAHVFGNEVGEPVDSLKTSWRATCRRAKIDGLNFHDLRREAASRMDDARVPRTVISARLGHKRTSTTDIYLGSTLAEQLSAMQAFAESRGDSLAELWQPPGSQPLGKCQSRNGRTLKTA